MAEETQSRQLHPALVEATLSMLKCRKCFEPNAFHGKAPEFPDEWSPPCGWAGLPIPGKTDLILVALNPGHPIDGAKSWRSLGFSRDPMSINDEHAREMNRGALQQYQVPGTSGNFTFHKKSVALARALLWLLDGRDPGHSLWARCWFTDAFKCSTRQESGPQIPKAGFVACRDHLNKELDICKPKLVVTLGSRAYRALGYQHKYPVVGFRHPSNGCPKLDGGAHDERFAKAAKLLGVSDAYDRESFRQVRRVIHESYFEPKP